MRHFRSSPLAIAALACGMGAAATARFLVTLAGFPSGMTAGGFRAPLAAVDIAPVAVAADHYLAATTGAVEQTRAALHRLLPPMRAGLEPNPERYFPEGRALHGLGGAAWGRLWRSRPVPRLSQRPYRSIRFRSACHLPSTRCRPASTSSQPPFPRQVFATLVGVSPRYSPNKRGFPEPSTGYVHGDSRFHHPRWRESPYPLARICHQRVVSGNCFVQLRAVVRDWTVP
jgi:hypothetical protein